MDFRNWFRSSLILIVLMVGIFMLGAAVGANIGPVELSIWLGVLVVGLILCALGSRRRSVSSPAPSSAK